MASHDKYWNAPHVTQPSLKNFYNSVEHNELPATVPTHKNAVFMVE